MPLRIRFSSVTDAFEKAINDSEQNMAEAASAAIRDVAEIAKQDARRSIAGAGFSLKWQNAMRANTYPRRGVSLGAAAVVFHKIPYAGIFEEGGTISGKPILWIPLPTIPKRFGDKPMTAERFRVKIGPLFQLNRPGRRPLLMARVQSGFIARHQGLSRLRGSLGKAQYDIASLRTGARNGNTMIPAFVGITQVQIEKKFGVVDAVQRAADRLPEFFLRNLKD